MISNIKQYILLSDICNNVIYVDSYHCEKNALDKIDKLSPIDNTPIYGDYKFKIYYTIIYPLCQ